MEADIRTVGLAACAAAEWAMNCGSCVGNFALQGDGRAELTSPAIAIGDRDAPAMQFGDALRDFQT